MSDQIHNSIEDFFENVIRKVLPHASLDWGMVYNFEQGQKGAFEGQINRQGIFINSPYWQSTDTSFLHFTSLNAVSRILETGYFRMTELNGLFDKNEVKYATKVFEDSPWRIEDEDLNEFRKGLYCLSMCEKSDQTLISHAMWESYADRGRGVCIEFTISDTKYSDFTLGGYSMDILG